MRCQQTNIYFQPCVVTKSEYLAKLGKHIANKRKEAGLNQTQLAEKCDKDRQSIQRLEKGGMNPTAYYLCEVAKALNIPTKELLNFD